MPEIAAETIFFGPTRQPLRSQSANFIPCCQGRRKDLKPAPLQILSALRGLLTGTRRSWSALIEP